MNFLGMGPMELVLIMVLALIVFGPGKLPEIAGQLGRMVRDFRRTTGEMSTEFNRAFSLELDETKTPESSSSDRPNMSEATPAITPPSLTSGGSSLPAEATPAMTAERAPGLPLANRRDDLLPPY